MSQEYTPVDWVDETTSQQGTLINAARLTQMQTAHHYADGFEEVDAIPTEDPGVDYHKVVYCTADATFYRWDGTQWTADIDEDTKHLLDQEIARATQAEGVLRADIIAEATAREGADTALGQRIDGLGADTLPMTHGTSTPTIQNAVAANAGNISNLANEVDGLEASKADKADTLAGYGITDAVATGGAQTVGGVKTFTDNPLVSNGEPAITIKNTDVSVSGTPASTEGATIHFAGSDGEDLARIKMTKGSSGMTILRAYIHGPHADGEVRLVSDTLGSYMTGPARAYDPANASDIMTIGVYKTQTDTLLAAKADTTALTDGSVTKVGTADLGTDTKPIKLVAGVPTAVTNDLVSTSGAQTIGGAKTLTAAPTILANNDFAHIDIKSTRASGNLGGILFKDGTGTTVNSIYSQVGGLMGITLEGTTKALLLTGQRDYNASNTSDIATIKTLDQYAPMVRTTGNQTIGGEKTLTSQLGVRIAGENHLNIQDTRMDLSDTASTSQYWNTVQFTDKNNAKIAQISAYQKGADVRLRLYTFKNGGGNNAVDLISDGTNYYMTAPARAYDPSHTGDVATIGTLDAYSPMVRTSGNQEIGGIKALWNPYYHGSISTNVDNGIYTDFGKFFNTGSFGNMLISIIGRSDYFLGLMSASHDAAAGVISTGTDGIKSASGKVTFYAAMLSDGGHLLAKRRTAASQEFTIQILGISNVTTSPLVVPKLTYPEVTITNELIQEIVTI